MLADQIAFAVAAKRDEIADLAADLVRFDTTARLPGDPPRQEAALQQMLAERLRRAGAEIELREPAPGDLARWARQVGTELDFVGRPQLVARWHGSGGGRSLVLNGHIDAVSAEPIQAWSVDPFAGTIDAGRLIGRGACDMKGGIAAMVVAAETVAASAGPLAGDLVINTVTDEESSGAGTLACIAAGLRADGVIVPEPTGFDVWVACRGSLTPTITIQGRPGHAELTQPDWRKGGAVNAIEKLQVVLDALARLREHWRTSEAQRHPYLAPGTIVPVLVDGGEWFVTYPASCRLTCELMYLPQGADERGEGTLVEAELEQWLREQAAADPWLALNPPSIGWGSDIPPAEIAADSDLAAVTLEAATSSGADGRIAGFDSWHDGASFIRAADSPAVAFGPPSTRDAHTIDESVSIDDLVTCAQTIALAAIEWCSAR